MPSVVKSTNSFFRTETNFQTGSALHQTVLINTSTQPTFTYLINVQCHRQCRMLWISMKIFHNVVQLLHMKQRTHRLVIIYIANKTSINHRHQQVHQIKRLQSKNGIEEEQDRRRRENCSIIDDEDSQLFSDNFSLPTTDDDDQSSCHCLIQQ